MGHVDGHALFPGSASTAYLGPSPVKACIPDIWQCLGAGVLSEVSELGHSLRALPLLFWFLSPSPAALPSTVCQWASPAFRSLLSPPSEVPKSVPRHGLVGEG